MAHPVELPTPTKAELELSHLQCGFEAKMLLLGNRFNRGLVFPTANEWVGLNVLDRDDQLAEVLAKLG